MSKFSKILVMALLCVGIGLLSGKVTQESVETWYPTLQKPFFNPPNWLFAPVWTTLYILMGIAAGLIWDKMAQHEVNVKKGLSFFFIQLGLNALWSFLFFGLQNPLLALLEITVLLLMIYETYVLFKKVSKTAGYLLIPYLLWVSFALVLNAGIWWLNR